MQKIISLVIMAVIVFAIGYAFAGVLKVATRRVQNTDSQYERGYNDAITDLKNRKKLIYDDAVIFVGDSLRPENITMDKNIERK